MKVRRDFVTNSSSSSFIIAKKYLDEDQIEAIREHYDLGKKMGLVDSKWDYPYSIEENDDFITGYVDMDNFAMGKFLDRIEVNSNNVNWGEYPFDLSKVEKSDNNTDGDSDWRKLLHENQNRFCYEQ